MAYDSKKRLETLQNTVDSIFEFSPNIQRTLRRVSTAQDKKSVVQKIEENRSSEKQDVQVAKQIIHITNDRILQGLKNQIEEGTKNLHIKVDPQQYPGVASAVYKLSGGVQTDIDYQLYEDANTVLENAQILHLGFDPIQAAMADKKDGEAVVPVLETPLDEGVFGSDDCARMKDKNFITYATDAEGNLQTQALSAAADQAQQSQALALIVMAFTSILGELMNWVADIISQLAITPIKPIVKSIVRKLRKGAEQISNNLQGTPPAQPSAYQQTADRGLQLSVTGLWDWTKNPNGTWIHGRENNKGILVRRKNDSKR